jgi:hypothetical protein
MASRGSSVATMIRKPQWFQGPDFLWKHDLPEIRQTPDIDNKDPEVKRVLATSIHEATISLVDRLERCSDWYIAKRAVANCKYIRILQDRVRRKTSDRQQATTIKDLCAAEVVIFKAVQASSSGARFDFLRIILSNLRRRTISTD